MEPVNSVIKTIEPKKEEDLSQQPTVSAPQTEEKKKGPSLKERKRARRKRAEAKIRRYAGEIGVEDNESYRRFKPKERLIMNLS